jgi:hypothetical protein
MPRAKGPVLRDGPLCVYQAPSTHPVSCTISPDECEHTSMGVGSSLVGWDQLHGKFGEWAEQGRVDPARVREGVIGVMEWRGDDVDTVWSARVGKMVMVWTREKAATPQQYGTIGEVFAGLSAVPLRHWQEQDRVRGRPRQLQWVKLRPEFWGNICRHVQTLGPAVNKVWDLLSTWAEHGAPLHYRGARRGVPRLKGIPTGDCPTVDKIGELLQEGGPLYGPFTSLPFPTAHLVSPILGVPKGDSDVRVVYHCSFPRTHRGAAHPQRSLNGGIRQSDFWLPVYERPDDLIREWLLRWEPHEEYVVFKLDFASAFRQIPVQQRDWELLCLVDAKTHKFYYETCAAFGTRISADLWLRFGSSLLVVLQALGYTCSILYVDDLAIIVRKAQWRRLMWDILCLEHASGVRVHWGKVFVDGGSTSCCNVLGLVVDVHKGVVHVDNKKRVKWHAEVLHFLSQPSWEVERLTKLCGALVFACTALPIGRMAMGPLYGLTSSRSTVVKVGSSHQARAALAVWEEILAMRSAKPQRVLFHPSEVAWVATDASPRGCGGVSSWGVWSVSLPQDHDIHINVLELFALWFSVCRMWVDQAGGKLVHVFVDNEVARLWAQKSPRLKAQSRPTVLKIQLDLARTLMQHGITIVTHRIPTAANSVADALSRGEVTWEHFGDDFQRWSHAIGTLALASPPPRAHHTVTHCDSHVMWTKCCDDMADMTTFPCAHQLHTQLQATPPPRQQGPWDSCTANEAIQELLDPQRNTPSSTKL